MVEQTTHILLVEDDSFLASIYKTKFEMEGFRVSLADNGEDGVVDAKKKKPDVILLDILLPRLDGFGVLARLKENKTTASIPVIIFTNLGQKEDVNKGLAMGAADYIIKAHFRPSEIIDKVKQVLKKHHYAKS